MTDDKDGNNGTPAFDRPVVIGIEDGIVRMVRWLGERSDTRPAWDDPILGVLTEDFALFARARQLWSSKS